MEGEKHQKTCLRLLDSRGGLDYSVLVSKRANGGVAQLVRAPACHAGGREFESRHSRHFAIELGSSNIPVAVTRRF